MKAARSYLILLSLTAAAVVAQDPGAEPEQPVEAAPTAEVEAIPAADAPPEATIPSPFPVTRYEAAWSKNPFMRKTVVIAAPQENWGKDWALNGMAEYDGKIRVTMVNKQTGEYKRVTNQDPEESEFRLVSANFNRNRDDASADIQRGGETVTIKYDENMASKPITINNTQRPPAGGGQSAQPNQMPTPGVAPRQGQPVTAVRPGNPGNVQGVAPQPGAVPMPGAVTAQPAANTPVPPGGVAGANTPPTISRRRQLVPAPVIPPQQ